jgi:hypothetical protein
MQFSYESADEMYCDPGLVGELGAPIGSLDACSISEAAYGALEQPVNCLEYSPLMNLHVNYIPLLRVYMSLSSGSPIWAMQEVFK